ncbi:MAG: SURF1 family protein [Pseudomonadota bacterium]
MQIRFKQWLFRPRLITSAIAILFFALFIKLGLWQLERAEFKSEKYETFLSKQATSPVDFNSLINVEDIMWRSVFAKGNFDNKLQILLDNRVIKSKAGYFVYTPFSVLGSDVNVLVNRGWVAAGTNRQQIPDIEVPDNLSNIIGVIKAEPLTGIVLKDLPPEEITDNIFRVQKINIEDLNEELNLRLLPYIIRLEPESDHGFIREWSIPGSDEATHLGYAYQWFAFAATLLAIYLLLNIKKTEQHE